MSENTNGLTVTLKAGVGFEAPWIVIHAADAADALKQIDTGDFATLAERTVAAAEFFRAAHNVKKGLSANEAPAPQPAPQQGGPSWSQQPSQQDGGASNYATNSGSSAGGKQCAHGAMTLREGVSAKGPWKGYFCPLKKGDPAQCRAEFVR